MPTWSGILGEIDAASQQYGDAAFDVVRLKYLQALAKHTKRNVILYASKWTQVGSAPAELITITDEDLQGLMEVIHGLESQSPLDLILHSPGGSPEATEALVDYLRTKFKHIRVIVPQAVMSAACMLACAADEIVMGKHSSLGPIDPQVILDGPTGPSMHPAQAILAQARLLEERCLDPKRLPIWRPLLEYYMPSILIECQNASDMSESLVAKWLHQWMLRDSDADGSTCRSIATQLNDHGEHKSHGRRIHRERAKELGLTIVDLETDQTLQDLVLSVFHATTLTFSATPVVKVIENHLGSVYLKGAPRALAAPAPSARPAPGTTAGSEC